MYIYIQICAHAGKPELLLLRVHKTTFFTARVTERKDRLTRDIVASLSLDIFESLLDVVLGATCSM